MNAIDDRTLLNWLSTRVDGKGRTRRGTEPSTDRQLAEARRRGLDVVSNQYISKPAGTVCDGCGKVFGGERAFSRHQVGTFDVHDDQNVVVKKATRRCLTDEELVARGFVRSTDNGKWSFSPFTTPTTAGDGPTTRGGSREPASPDESGPE